MDKTPFGFLTRSGYIAALVVILVVVVVTLAMGGVLFSPGGLNAVSGAPLGGASSHSSLTGQCNQCHVSFWSRTTMADRCLGCHTDVSTQRLNTSSLHGLLYQSNPSATCRNCHPDHHGPLAPLTVMDMSLFPHEAEGYSLAAHKLAMDGSPFTCKGCHAHYSIAFDQSVCTTCHAQLESAFIQTHSQDFGSACLNCHDGVDTYGRKFNHDLVAFNLIGKHAPLACAQCHIKARTLADLQNAPRDCFSCHNAQDAHQGRLATNCGGCHNPDGWTPALMDHNLASFKLVGLHVDVACSSCHIKNVYYGTPSDCLTCHRKDDPHKGQFGNQDCGACHTASGWTPSTYDHKLSTFKLIGKHVNVACDGCHVNGIFKGTPTACYACHQKDDPHKGQFGTTDCGLCHTPSAWKPAVFDHSRFPLTNGHAVACARCHSNGIYVGLSTACVSCHSEPAIHAGMFGTNCASCHNTSNWNATFNHPNACGEGGCINHHGASCTTCHTNSSNYRVATCTKCHGNNGPGGD
jgi:hypothetical protein